MYITSRENSTYKMIKTLMKKKGRLLNNMYFAEGVRIVKEALLYAEDMIEYLLVAERSSSEDWIKDCGKEVTVLRDNLFDSLCNTETPQGVAAVLRMPENTQAVPENAKYLLVIDGVSEPGNLGTIIRTAEAAGVDMVCIRSGSADLYNPKVVRSTMGSIFRLPVVQFDEPEFLLRLKENGFSVIATALSDDSVSPDELPKLDKRAIVIGSEAFGVSPEVIEASDFCLKLPMSGRVESLNAAVAAGIVLYFLR